MPKLGKLEFSYGKTLADARLWRHGAARTRREPYARGRSDDLIDAPP